MNRWYLVRSKVGCEAQAQTHLEDQAYRTYFPRLISKRRRFGRRVEAITPLFPQYLFLSLLLGEQDLGPARSTKGVLNIVRFGGEYAVVPERVIDLIRAREDPTVRLHRLEERGLKPQSRIRITKGPFFGIEGLYLHECGSDRVTVLLNLLGRDTELAVEESLVEACA